MQALGAFEKIIRLSLRRLAGPVVTALLTLVYALPCLAAEPVAVFPGVPYDGYIVFESLAVFWIIIVALIVVIRMKLREIERTQQLGADEEDPNAPLLP